MNKKKIKEKLHLTGGSTRLVFFFGKTAVKIPRLDLGLKGLRAGMESNREEYIKWNKAKGENIPYIRTVLCPVKWISFYGFFLGMEKADEFLNDYWYKVYEKELNHKKYEDWFNDVTIHNVMLLRDRVVMVDYAHFEKAKKGGYKR